MGIRILNNILYVKHCVVIIPTTEIRIFTGVLCIYLNLQLWLPSSEQGAVLIDIARQNRSELSLMLAPLWREKKTLLQLVQNLMEMALLGNGKHFVFLYATACTCVMVPPMDLDRAITTDQKFTKKWCEIVFFLEKLAENLCVPQLQQRINTIHNDTGP